MSKLSNLNRYEASAEAYPSTTAYTANDQVGSVMEFAGVIDVDYGGGLIESVTVVDASSEGAALRLVLFSASPSNTATQDNAVLTLADSDLDNVIGTVDFAASDYTSFADNAVGSVQCELPFYLEGARDLYGLLMAVGTPTYDDTDDIVVKINVLRE